MTMTRKRSSNLNSNLLPSFSLRFAVGPFEVSRELGRRKRGLLPDGFHSLLETATARQCQTTATIPTQAWLPRITMSHFQWQKLLLPEVPIPSERYMRLNRLTWPPSFPKSLPPRESRKWLNDSVWWFNYRLLLWMVVLVIIIKESNSLPFFGLDPSSFSMYRLVRWRDICGWSNNNRPIQSWRVWNIKRPFVCTFVPIKIIIQNSNLNLNRLLQSRENTASFQSWIWNRSMWFPMSWHNPWHSMRTMIPSMNSWQVLRPSIRS